MGTTVSEALRTSSMKQAMDAYQVASALDRVEALCQRWDVLTKGESPTTAAIRKAVQG